jgi:hypothetical protein
LLQAKAIHKLSGEEDVLYKNPAYKELRFSIPYIIYNYVAIGKAF